MNAIVVSVLREAIAIARHGASTAPADWSVSRGSMVKRKRSGRIFVTARVGPADVDGPIPTTRIVVQRSFDGEDDMDSAAFDLEDDGEFVVDAASSKRLVELFDAASSSRVGA